MWLSFILFTLLLEFALAGKISCRDDEGNPVDWFVGYKLPSSLDYIYITPNKEEWKRSQYTIDQGGMLKNTYDGMFDLNGQESSLYGMYNDEKPSSGLSDPDPDKISWGHMKGAFAFDESSGFWVIHSIPKLSESMDHYVYPHTGRVYGQHMLCITLEPSYIPDLIKQLAISRPLIQSSYISSDWKDKYPDILPLFQNKRSTHTTNATLPFVTMGESLKMRHFSKSVEYGKDLYLDFVMPSLGLGLKVETWRHGGSEPSYCKRGDPVVMNIESLKFDDVDAAFSSYSDHAKWATTFPLDSQDNKNNMWVCLGDINRQHSQFHRGGGTMCIQNKLLWKAFSDAIEKVQKCSSACSDPHDPTCEEL